MGTNSTSWLQRERLFALEQWTTWKPGDLISFSKDTSGEAFICVLHGGRSILLGMTPDSLLRIPWFESPGLALSDAVFSPSDDLILCLSVNGSLHVLSRESLLPSSKAAGGGPSELHRKSWLPPLEEGRSLCPILPQWSSTGAAPKEALCLLWWNYGDLLSAGIIGTQEGDIIVVDLVSAMEIGRVFVSKSGVIALEVSWDVAMDCFYLFITDGERNHWRFLLEQRSSGYTWPRSQESRARTPPPIPEPRPPPPTTMKASNSIDDLSGPPRSRLAAGIKNMSVASLASLRQKLSEGKRILDRMGGTGALSSENTLLSRPEPLSGKLGDSFLSVIGSGMKDSRRSLLGVHSDMLTLYNVDLEPGKVFSLPPSSRRALLANKFILASSNLEEHGGEENGEALHILSSALSEFNSSKSSGIHHPLVQSFRLAPSEVILGYHVLQTHSKSTLLPSQSCSSSSCGSSFDAEVTSRLASLTCPHNLSSRAGFFFREVLVFSSRGVYRLSLKRDPISSFLELSMRGDLGLAEEVAAAFLMDSKNLLELAGDIRLRDKDINGALKLYRVAGLKQFKTVLKLSLSGHTPELLAILASLFKSPVNLAELPPLEKAHLSNLAILAYFQQVLTKITPSTRSEFRNEIKDFLGSNRCFDELLPIRLASDTKEWDLLSYFSRIRGLREEAVSDLIEVIGGLTGCPPADNLKLISKVLQAMPSSERNSLLSCLLDPLNLEVCAASGHGGDLIRVLSGSLPLLEEEGLQAVAVLSAPENPSFRPLLQREGSAILNLFLTSLLLLIKKRMTETCFNPSLTEISLPKKAEPFPEEKNRKYDIYSNVLATGGNHVLLLRRRERTEDGRQGSILYSWGSTAKGALGRGPSSANYEPLSEVPYFRENNIDVISVSAGGNHSMALTNYGLYTWGHSKYGQCGHGSTLDSKRPCLVKALAGVNVIDISAGRYHSLALDSDGGVWSWGLGVHGQLGHDDIEDLESPQKIDCLRKVRVVQIAAGYTHSVVLSSRGRVYSFGNNLFGQLGNGLTVKSKIPTATDLSVMQEGERIQRIRAGFFHTLALTNQGRLLSWGSNPQIIRLETQSRKRLFLQNMRNAARLNNSNAGAGAAANNNNTQPILLPSQDPTAKQLKKKEDPQTHLRPVSMDLSPLKESRIISFSAGNQHSMVLSESSCLYGLGLNSQGQLGNQSRMDSKGLVQVPGLSEGNLIGVACGMDFSLVMGGDGCLFAWGNNSNGTLGVAPLVERGDYWSYKDKILLMPNRRIRLNEPSPNSWDSPKPVPGSLPASPLDSKGSFNQNVSVELMETVSPPERSFDLRQASQVPLYLHATLEAFQPFLDSKTLIKKCLISENPQAASKISLLEGNMLQAFEFTLQSIIKSHPTGQFTACEAVFGAFRYYLLQSAGRSSLSDEDEEEDRGKSERGGLFERLVACWQDQKWSFVHLEGLISQNACPTLLQILVITLFRPSGERRTDKGPVINQESGPKLVDLFTPEFCLKIGDTFVNGLKEKDGSICQSNSALLNWIMTSEGGP